MKRIIGYAILGVIGYYLWRNHFKRLFQPKDQVKEILEEVRTKNEIGDNKRAVYLANQVPTSTIGDTPYAGTPLTAFTADILREPKDLQLLPKGGNTSKNPFDRVVAWLNILVLLGTLAGAGVATAAVPMTTPATNALGEDGWVFWDDFNKPLRRSGVMPDSPTGHRYLLIDSVAGNTNGLTLANGGWYMNRPGALYMSVSNNFQDPGGAIFGSYRRFNKFAGVVRFNHGLVDDGVERNLGFVLSSNANFVGSSPMFLHCSFGDRGVQIQRELSSTNFINEDLPNSSYGAYTTWLIYGTNYPWTLTIVSNTITVTYAGYTFQKTDPIIGMYGRMNVLTIESIGTRTNQIYGEWRGIAAGYVTAADQWSSGGPFIVGTTNFLLAGLRLEEGTTSARSGTATLASGLATVNTTAVSAKSRFRLGYVANTATAVQPVCVTNIVNGTSFQIRSLSNTDGNRVDWEIVEKSP